MIRPNAWRALPRTLIARRLIFTIVLQVAGQDEQEAVA